MLTKFFAEMFQFENAKDGSTSFVKQLLHSLDDVIKFKQGLLVINYIGETSLKACITPTIVSKFNILSNTN